MQSKSSIGGAEGGGGGEYTSPHGQMRWYTELGIWWQSNDAVRAAS